VTTPVLQRPPQGTFPPISAPQVANTGHPRAGRRRGAALIKVLIVGTVLAGGGLAAYGLWGGPAKATAGRGHKASADLATVARTSFDITTTVSGDLQARKQIEVRSQLESESTIVEIVPEGTLVKKGDTLVVLNSETLQNRLIEEQSRLESAKAELTAAESALAIQESENESKLSQARLKLELARLALAQWENGERAQKLKDIQLALEKTEKELLRLTEKYEQSVRLNEEGFLSKNEMQMDEIALREARAAREKALLEDQTYRTYQEPMDRAKKESDVTEAQRELDRTAQQNKSQYASKEADLVNKRRQHQMRTDNVAKFEKQLAACTLTAPSEGLVVYGTSVGGDFFMFNGNGPLQVGRRVMPNETLITLPDTSEMIAQVRVPESLAGRVAKGLTASVKVDAASGEVFTGQVDSIGVLAESSWRDPNRREYTVKILLHNERGIALKPSMRCEATITLGRVEDAVSLPVQAVFTDEAVKFAYVPRGGKFARVPVKIGQRSDAMAEVVAGLKGGERVLIREPSPAEVLGQDWDAAELKLCGLKLGDDGKVVAMDGPKGPAGPGRSGPGGPGGPGGMASAGTQGPAASVAAKPEGADAPPANETKPEGAERRGENQTASGVAAAIPGKGDKPGEAAKPAHGEAVKPEAVKPEVAKVDGKVVEDKAQPAPAPAAPAPAGS
jgi:HlyD family secretion protein